MVVYDPSSRADTFLDLCVSTDRIVFAAIKPAKDEGPNNHQKHAALVLACRWTLFAFDNSLRHTPEYMIE
jgi:hypothetical protein